MRNESRSEMTTPIPPLYIHFPHRLASFQLNRNHDLADVLRLCLRFVHAVFHSDAYLAMSDYLDRLLRALEPRVGDAHLARNWGWLAGHVLLESTNHLPYSRDVPKPAWYSRNILVRERSGSRLVVLCQVTTSPSNPFLVEPR